MTVVVRDGKLFDVGDARKSWPLAGTSMPTRVRSSKSLDLVGFDLRSSYGGIYASQPWIHALVNKLARNIARLPLMSYAENLDENVQRPLNHSSHELPLLLRRPYPRGSKFKLVEALVGSTCIYGHALWWKYRPRAGAPPAELWPIDWRYIEMQTGRDAPIDYYEYQGPAGRKIFLPEDVAHFRWWSPNGEAGTSPLEPLRLTLSLEDAGRRYSVASFANGIRPSGALVSERALDDDDRDELKAELEATHSNPDNAFRMMLLDGGLDWKSMGQTAVDAQLLELRKLNHVEACAVYDVPPPVVHILDRATYSNITEQHAMLYVDTIGPWLGMIEETIHAELVDGEPSLAAAFVEETMFDTKVAFDLSELLRPDLAARMTAYKSGREAGAYTINDVRQKEGLPKISHPAADAVLIPLNMDVVGSDGTGEELGLTPRGNPVQAAMLTLADHLQRASDETARDVKELAAKIEAGGQKDLAAAMLAVLEQSRPEPVRVELEPKHEHVTQHDHYHKHELHEHHELDAGAVRAQVEEAIDSRAPGTKQFEYDGDGLVARVVTIRGDGTKDIREVRRGGDGRLLELEPVRDDG